MFGGSFSPGTPLSDSNNYSYYDWNFDLGIGLRENIARPIQDVYIQWIVLLGYGETFQQQTDSYGDPALNSQSQSLSLFTGPGFEAFLPFFKNLSVEANLGLYISSTWIEGSNDNGWSWGARLGSDGSTFSLFNAAAHFYF
jgi:hypothetical protein